MSTKTSVSQCKAKNGWQSCRFHGSGFSHFRVNEVTKPLQEKTSNRYTKLLRATLLSGEPTSDVTKGYVEKAKMKASVGILMNDATPEGMAHLDDLIKQARREGDSTFLDLFYARKYDAEDFNELLDVEEQKIADVRERAEEAAIRKFGDVKTAEAKQFRDNWYKEKIIEMYETNPRIKTVHGSAFDTPSWNTQVANEALLECVRETLRKVKN